MELPKGGEERVLIRQYGKIIFEQRFTLPNGDEGDFLLMKTSKNDPAIIILPITADNRVIAIRQFRYGANEVVLELPGGMPKPGQNPEEVASDELVEETGYRAGKLIRLAPKIWFEPAFTRVPFIPFLATGCTRVQGQNLEQFELIELVDIPLGEWLKNLSSGEVDSKSLAVTMLAMPHLKDR